MQKFKVRRFRWPALCLFVCFVGCNPKQIAFAVLAAPEKLAVSFDPSICAGGYVRIEPGTFVMGSPAGEEGRESSEAQHSVTITRAYCMKATEVTQGEWQAVVDATEFEWSLAMGSNPSQLKFGSNYPVDQVSSSQAILYANALSRLENLSECYDGTTLIGLDCQGYRLPTEAEWEYAERAGTTEATYGDPDSIAWFGKQSGLIQTFEEVWNGQHPVGQKLPNAWGLYDMLGSVWEWTEDWYAPFTPSAATDPIGHGSNFRVIRGGSRNEGASQARAASRSYLPPDVCRHDIGFRLVRTLP